MSGVSIFDGGTIIGSGGTAIVFAGSGNTLTLGSGYDISGSVNAVGSNTLQLGGIGSETVAFSSLVGSGADYHGFTTFNVVGGTWAVTGSGSDWNIDSGGTMEVVNGADLSGSFVNAGGVLVVEPGGIVSGVTISSGGAIELLSGASSSGYTLNTGANLDIGSGDVYSSGVSAAYPVNVLSGGTFSGGAVESGAKLTISGGGVDSGSTSLKGGSVIVSSGGESVSAIVSGGGTELVSAHRHRQQHDRIQRRYVRSARQWQCRSDADSVRRHRNCQRRRH